MRTKIIAAGIVGTGLLVVGTLALQPRAVGAAAAAPNIEGTYRLVSRTLPDGKVLKPPQVIGLVTFAKGYRNFNVYWRTDRGKPFSIGAVAHYWLTAKEYREANIYYFQNDQINGTGGSYSTVPETAASPVTIKGSTIEFQLPLHSEPKVAFDSKGFTATRKGEFVDHWEKVK